MLYTISMKNIIFIVILSFLIGGCSAIQGKVTEVVGNDLQRTIEIAEKHGKPEIAKCAQYLKQSIDGDAALAGENTAGLISTALKLYLLQESKPVAEEQFKAQCGNVAAGLMLQAGKSARR